jgi:hypothetical protein
LPPRIENNKTLKRWLMATAIVLAIILLLALLLVFMAIHP